MKKKSVDLSNVQRAIGKKIPGGYLSVTHPLFPGLPRLYDALNAEGIVVARAEDPAELVRNVRALRKTA